MIKDQVIKELKQIWNSEISSIAEKIERDLKHHCKVTNTYYPPLWYHSPRGTEIPRRLLDFVEEVCNER